MYKLKYYKEKKKVILVDKYVKTKFITDNHPSEPKLSPNKEKAIFISPLEWEMLGSLYLVNLENGGITELISPDQNQNIPKYSEWIDNENFAVVIGYGMGTVEVGGNAFIYNILNKELKQITFYKSEIQLTNLKFEKDVLVVSGIKYTDDNYNNSVSFKDYISL